MLTLAIPRRDVKDLAKTLLHRFGDLRAVLDAPRADLTEVEGLGPAGAFLFEFFRSIVPLYLKKPLHEQAVDAAWDKLTEFWGARIGHETKEVFEVAYFDPALRLQANGITRHSTGTTDRSAVFPAEVMRDALRRNAFALAFAHNHPSGDSSPSDMDKLITRQLILAATAVQLKVLDHIIVSPQGCFSFREAGLL